MSSTTLTIEQLRLSPFNVRTNQQDATATSALEKSILERGIILALLVHPLRGNKNRWGVYDGGRRYRSIRALADRGEWPADRPIAVIVHDLPDAELIEDSAVVGMLRRDLRPYELFAAVAAAHRKGDRPEKIAEALGQEITWIRQALRLGNLAKPIFEALEADRISVDVARAYAATEDHALQLATFEELKPLPEWQRTPEKIRARMKIGDLESQRRLRFVGAEAYREAGGRFELDLFADGETERGRVVDEGLLAQLLDARLQAVRDEARVRTQRKDLRLIAKRPETEFNSTDWTLQVTPKRGDGDTLILPEGDVVGFIEVAEGGEPLVTYWWSSRTAKHGKEKAGARAGGTPSSRTLPPATGSDALRDPYTYAPAAKAAAKDEHGVSSDALETICSMRRELLRALVVEDAYRGGSVGRDYVTWAMLRQALTLDGTAAVGARGVASGGTINSFELAEKAKAHVDMMHAHTVWESAVRDLSAKSFMTEPDLAAAFLDYLRASVSEKHQAGAVLAGIAFERTANAPGFQVGVHDAIAQVTNGGAATIRDLWSPTAEFLDMLPKAQRLAIGEPIISADSYRHWQKAKAAELPALLARALEGIAIPSDKVAAAQSWVHPLLQFVPIEEAPADDAAALQEAAA